MFRTVRPFAGVLLALSFRPPASRAAQPLDVVVNEIAWSGTAASGSDEWIELLNTTSQEIWLGGWTLKAADGTPSIVLSGTLPAHGYFLLERTDDAAVSDVPARMFFSGAVANGPPAEDFLLVDESSRAVDGVFFAAAGWPAGTASPEVRSVERVDPARPGSLAANWASNDGVVRNGLDAGGGALNGTPGRRNSAFGTLREACGNGRDDDLDGKADCLDEECALDDFCRVAEISPADADGPALEAEPGSNPFSPRDLDPARRAVRLIYRAGSPGAVKSVRVYDARGAVVRWLLNQDRGADGRNYAGARDGALLWDGTDDRGNGLPTGIYIVTFEAVDPGGGQRRARVPVALAR